MKFSHTLCSFLLWLRATQSPHLYWKVSQRDGYNEMQPEHTSLRPSQLAVKTVFQQHSFLQNYCDFFSDKVSKIHFHYTTLTCSKKIKSKNHFVIFLNKYIRPFLFQIICNLLQKTSQTYLKKRRNMLHLKQETCHQIKQQYFLSTQYHEEMHLFSLPVKSVIWRLENTSRNNGNVTEMSNYHMGNK